MRPAAGRIIGAACAVGVVAAMLAAARVPTDAGAAEKKRGAAVPKAKAQDPSAQVLVRIGREAITRGDVEKRIESLPPQFRSTYATPEGRQQLLDRLVEERVWVTLARKKGVADRPEVKDQLERQRNELLVRTYVNELMAASPAPSDSEARAFYDEHLDDYKIPASVTLSHIQTRSKRDAETALKWAKRGYDWGKLVQRYSTDSLSRARGGSLGTVTRNGVFASLGSQPALAESAFTLSAGQVGGPYPSDRGWHVLKVESVKPESVRPFDQVQQVITRQMGQRRSMEYYQERLGEARRELKVSADSTAIKDFVSQRRSPREMFDEAQALTAPNSRIEAYQRLLDEYPDSDVSPQAQFMVGFIYSEELKDFDRAEAAFRRLLQRYPDAELAPSAQWMLDHMRTEDTPEFISMDEDSTGLAKSPPEKPKAESSKP